ncbi:MAG: hypothetical protein JSV49_03000, partial [Thermoplasmata archaeon]
CELDVQFPGSSLWEKLGSATYLDGIWQMDFVPARDYPIGMYSFSANAYDGDIVSGKSPPFTLTDILKVKNNPGRVTNLSVEDPEVFRLHNIDIMIEAEDVENPEVSLIGTVEYRHNGTQPSDWKDLSTLSYQYEGAEGYWVSVFKPEKNAELGMYDFRASFEDLDGESEGWVYYNRAVKVENNLPIIESIEVLPDTIVGNDSVTITVTGYDSEHTRSELTCQIEVVPAAETGWQHLDAVRVKDQWDAVFTSGESAVLGYYNVRSRLIDPDMVDSNNNIIIDDPEELWTLDFSAFFIKKDIPNMKNVSIQPSSIEQKGKATIEVTTEGDLSENSELTCIIQYQGPSDSETSWNTLSVQFDGTTGKGVWRGIIEGEETEYPGEYKFRVRFIHPELGATDWIYPADTLTVEDAEPEPTRETSDKSSQIINWIIIIVTIIILIILLFAVLYKKRKDAKKAEAAASMKAIGTPSPQVQAEWLPKDAGLPGAVAQPAGLYGSLQEPSPPQVAAVPVDAQPAVPMPQQQPAAFLPPGTEQFTAQPQPQPEVSTAGEVPVEAELEPRVTDTDTPSVSVVALPPVEDEAEEAESMEPYKDKEQDSGEEHEEEIKIKEGEILEAEIMDAEILDDSFWDSESKAIDDRKEKKQIEDEENENLQSNSN